MLLLSTGVAICSDADKPANNPDNNSPADLNEPNGPTITLSYSSRTSEEIPFASFMYFVPLVSPDTVDVEVSANNEQKVATVSYEKKFTRSPSILIANLKCPGMAFTNTSLTPPK